MSDTVSSAAIISSLESQGPAFLSLSDATDASVASAVHVPGAAYLEPASFSLLVDFRTLAPHPQAGLAMAAGGSEPPASVSGYVYVALDDPSPGVAGALQQG